MILLDTNALIFFLFRKEYLTEDAERTIIFAESASVSMVSLWEIAIKQSLRKIDLDCPSSQLARLCEENGFSLLPIRPNHLDRLKDLPFIHKDPFDRMLIAQAKAENLTFLTHDELLPYYGEYCIVPV